MNYTIRLWLVWFTKSWGWYDYSPQKSPKSTDGINRWQIISKDGFTPLFLKDISDLISSIVPPTAPMIRHHVRPPASALRRPHRAAAAVPSGRPLRVTLWVDEHDEHGHLAKNLWISWGLFGFMMIYGCDNSCFKHDSPEMISLES